MGNFFGRWTRKIWREWVGPFSVQWLYTAVLLVTAWGSMLWVIYTDFDQTVETVYRENDQLVTVLEEHVRRSLRSVDDNLLLIKKDYERAGIVTPAVEDIFEQVANHPLMVNLFISDANGRGVSTRQLALDKMSIAESEHFQSLRKLSAAEPFVGKPHIGKVSGKPSVVIARRLQKENSTFNGVVAIALSPEYFTRFYQNIDFEPGQVIRVVGVDGFVRASLDSEIKTLAQNLERGSLFEELKKTKQGRYLSSGNIFGVYRYYSYRQMSDYPLVVQVGKDRDIALAPYTERRNLYLSAGVIGSTILLLYTSGLVWLMNRRRRDAERWQLALEATNDGIWDWDAATRQMYYSPRWKEILGFRDEEIGSSLKEWQMRIHPDDREKTRDALNKHLFRGAATYQSEIRLRSKNGSYKWVRCRGRGIRSTQGEVVRMVGAISDISEEKNAERILRHDAEVARRLQRRMLPKLVESPHLEIRTLFHPLQYVSGDLYFLDWRYDGNVLRGYLADVTGHGIGTALYTAALNVLLHEVNDMDLPLGEQVRWLNLQASRYFDEGSFAAMLAFEIDLQVGEMRYVGAGITEIWLHTEKQTGRLPVYGLFLGLDKMESYTTHTIPLQEGDNIYFVTDGISDLVRKQERLPVEHFGETVKLIERLAHSSQCRDDATAISISLRSLTRGCEMSIMWPRNIQLNGYGDYTRFKGDISRLLADWTGQSHSLQEIAVNEAVVNALECRDGIVRPHRARIRINCFGNRLVVRVRTSRIGFAGNAVLERLRSTPQDFFSFGVHETMGRGIPLMLQLSDWMTYNQDGTEVMLVWRKK